MIVKPKEKQSIIKTKDEINKVSKDNLKIINVESRSGAIVIQSENCEERERIKMQFWRGHNPKPKYVK